MIHVISTIEPYLERELGQAIIQLNDNGYQAFIIDGAIVVPFNDEDDPNGASADQIIDRLNDECPDFNVDEVIVGEIITIDNKVN